MSIENYITVSEYAKLHDLSPATVRQRILRGATKAIKVGSVWLIRRDEPLKDHREKKKDNSNRLA